MMNHSILDLIVGLRTHLRICVWLLGMGSIGGIWARVPNNLEMKEVT